ncbi:MAG: hypothetical protein E6R11_01765 [Rhodocyclaceae bacterium]|nr:MAG: hypothetical protein E6R11_01765 [Rhodocyclaceae bacterium]
MQTITRSDPSVELDHPDFFAEQHHPDGIAHISLAEIFGPSPTFEILDTQDIRETKQKLDEAKNTLMQLEQNYAKNDCHDVLHDKAVLETVGSVGAWAAVFLPLIPQTKVGVALAVVLGAVTKVATDTSNETGKEEAYKRCERYNADIAQQQNRVEAAQERYEAAVKEMFGVYSQSVRRKQTSETRIRDWKTYAYKLGVHLHQIDPSEPKPSAPVYAFRATPVPAERVMRLGANMLQQAVKAGGL